MHRAHRYVHITKSINKQRSYWLFLFCITRGSLMMALSPLSRSLAVTRTSTRTLPWRSHSHARILCSLFPPSRDKKQPKASLQSLALDTVLHALDAADQRVRDQAARCLASMCPRLYFPQDWGHRHPLDVCAERCRDAHSVFFPLFLLPLSCIAAV